MCKEPYFFAPSVLLSVSVVDIISAFNYLKNNYPFVAYRDPFPLFLFAFGPFHCSLLFVSESKYAI